MKTFIGTKIINAMPMMRLDYITFRGWTLPEDENGLDEGYLVEYIDSDNSNTKAYKGYVSWSPKKEFEDAYRETNGMNFGLAIEAMKKGFKVARTGWNGKGMFLFLVDGSTFTVNRKPLLGIYPEGTEVTYNPHIDMKYVNGNVGAWNAAPNDILGEDWYIV